MSFPFKKGLGAKIAFDAMVEFLKSRICYLVEFPKKGKYSPLSECQQDVLKQYNFMRKAKPERIAKGLALPFLPFFLYCFFKVEFEMPQEDSKSWFYILVLHQNRAKHGPTNYIPEYFLPDFLHLVVWGHEHECRIEPEKMDMDFYVTQPGSPCATSLCEGESKQKKVNNITPVI